MEKENEEAVKDCATIVGTIIGRYVRLAISACIFWLCWSYTAKNIEILPALTFLKTYVAMIGLRAFYQGIASNPQIK